MHRTLLSSVILAACVALASPVRATDAKVVLVGPMTGQFATFWEQLKRGVDLAAAEVNDTGGVPGGKVVVEYADDACDPKQAVSAANRNVNLRPQLVVGHFCSGTSVAAADVYAENGILMISPGSVVSRLTERGMWNVFRTVGRDDQQGYLAAKSIVDRKLGTSIAIIHDKSTYGRGLADNTKLSLNALGVKEKVFDSINPGERDFSSLISSLKSQAIDLVYFGGYHTEAALLVRQATEQGLKARFVAGDALKTTEFAQIAGPAADGVMFTFFPDPRDNAQAASAVAKMRQAGFEPEGFTLYTYAAVQVWADAARRAKSVDAKKVADDIRRQPVETVIGTLVFNAKGDPDRNLYQLFVWHGGKYRVADAAL